MRKTFVHRLLVGVTFALTLTTSGCPFRQAIERGDEYAETGNWERAVTEYAAAAEIDPEDQEAIDKLSEARGHASATAIEDAESALARRQYEAAVTRVADAERYGSTSPRVAAIRVGARDGLIADTKAALGRHELRAAYSLGATAAKLFPGSPEAVATLTSVRQEVIATGNRALEGGKYPEAKASFKLIARFEPHREREARGHLQRVDQAWATALRTQATTDERRGALGTALVRYAMAYALSKSDGDRAARDQLRAQLVATGSVRLAVDVRGDPSRRSKFARAMRRRVDGTSLLTWDARGDQHARIDLPNAACESQSRRRQATQRYLSGTQEVRNPDWTTLDEQSRSLERDLGTARDELARAQRQHSDTLDKLQRTGEADRKLRRRELNDLQRKVDQLRDEEQDLGSTLRALEDEARQGASMSNTERRLRDQLDTLSRKLDAIEKRLRKRRDKLERLRREDVKLGSPEDQRIRERIEAFEEKIQRMEHTRDDLVVRRDRTEQELRRVQKRTEDRQVETKIADTRRRLDRLRTDIRQVYESISETATGSSRYHNDLERLRRDLDAVAEAINTHESHIRQVEQKKSEVDRSLANTPPTVTEKTYANFRYEIEDWTRICETSASAVLTGTQRASWHPNARATTSDSSNAGYRQYGVAADPLHFPKGDAQLIAECDGQLVANLDAQLRKVGAGHRQQLLTEANRLAPSNQTKAVDLMVTAHLLDPAQDRSTIATFLKSALALEDLGQLTR